METINAKTEELSPDNAETVTPCPGSAKPGKLRAGYRRWGKLLASFFVPVFILAIALALTGIYPFGQQQIAVIDMYHQYVPFLGEFQQKLQNGGSLFYSWNGGGGCNFWCVISYYCASPLNLILILFPKKLIMEGVTVVLLIKVGLTGAFMYTYLKNVVVRANTGGVFNSDRYNAACITGSNCRDAASCSNPGWHTVAFSTMYALCAYVIGYYWCIMWLEAIMLLPLVMLGLNRLIEDGRMVLYTVSLALTVFCNYYMAIMVCIFILVYYPVLYFTKVTGGTPKRCLTTTVRAIVCSLLGIAMAGVMLIPTYISMKSAYYFSSQMPDELSFYEDALDVINQLLPNAHLTYLEGLPNLCCGMLATVMLVFYFITREIPLREKLLNGALLAVMFLSLNINKLDFIWHGMHFPNQLPFRFSFVICFLIVAMAYRAFNRMDSISKNQVYAVIGSGIAYYLIAQKLLEDKIDDGNLFFYSGVALLTMYGVILAAYRMQKLSLRAFKKVVMIAVIAELCVSTYAGFDTVGNSSKDTYNENKADITALGEYAAKISAGTSGGGSGTFGRTELDNQIICNCPAFYHYRGLGQFSSTLNSTTTELMEEIGLEANPAGNRFSYNETNPVTNCITNVNYLISKNEGIDDPDFTRIQTRGYSGLYESRYPMSIGYMLPESIRTWDTADRNPFNNLEDYVRAATSGEVTHVFEDKGKGDLSGDGLNLHYEGDGEITSTLRGDSDYGTAEITYEADTDEKYYVYVEADYGENIEISVEGENENIEVDEKNGSVLNIGNMKEGQKFTISVQFESGQAGRICCHVCTLDYGKWDKAYEMISANPMTLIDSGDGYIKGNITVDEEGILVTSIPYDEGWQLKVNGEERDLGELTGGAWISTYLSPGEHDIELRFTPPGILIGAMSTVLALIVLICLCIIRRKGKRKAAERLDGDELWNYSESDAVPESVEYTILKESDAAADNNEPDTGSLSK